MEDASKFIGGLVGASSLREVHGTCQTHGDSTALLHSRFGPQEWFCGECALAAKNAADYAVWAEDRKKTLYRGSCVPDRYLGARFQVSTAAQREVRATVRAFRDAIGRERKWATLILVGITGTGKTLLACELAQSLIENLLMSVRYCTAMQMISEIQASYNDDRKTEEGEVRRFAGYDLLILDEIDAMRSTDNARSLLTEVMNRRYNAKKPVVVITNQTLEELPKYVGDRVYSRLEENSLKCTHDWADQRVATAC
jgi:DNA replication protein DnaC